MSVKIILATSALAASSLVSAVVLPIRQAPSSEQTCADQTTGYKYITRLASNVQYEVICGADYYGSDLADGIKWPGSFEGCLAECDANTECKAVSWANGPCYLKGGAPTLVSGNDAVWAAMKNPAPTCDGDINSNGASYITSAGDFEIMCGWDYAGNDLPTSKRVDSFADCIELCAADQQCVDVSYEYGACYPKSAASNLIAKDSIWTAKFSGSRTGPSPSPVASSSATTPTPTPEVPKAITCAGENNDNGKQYRNFEVQCGNDHGGADIGAVPVTTTFEECMDACEENGECVAVSWVWGTCYMKSAANPGQTGVEHVWGAVRPTRVASSSVAVEPTVTPSASSGASVVPEMTSSIEFSSSVTPIPTPTESSTLVTVTSSSIVPTITVLPTIVL